MFTLSQYPRGLLDLLSIQSEGRGPQSLSEVVAPTIDLMQMYWSRLSSVTGNQFVAQAAGLVPLAGTAAGSLRIIKQLSIRSSIAAGQAGRAAIVLRYPSTGANEELLVTEFTGLEAAAAAQSETSSVFDFPSFLLVPAGAVLQARVAVTYGAGSNFQWGMHYADVRAGA